MPVPSPQQINQGKVSGYPGQVQRAKMKWRSQYFHICSKGVWRQDLFSQSEILNSVWMWCEESNRESNCKSGVRENWLHQVWEKTWQKCNLKHMRRTNLWEGPGLNQGRRKTEWNVDKVAFLWWEGKIIPLCDGWQVLSGGGVKTV